MEISITEGVTVSREQSRVIFVGGRMYIENLSKTNFTFLNDVGVQNSQVFLQYKIIISVYRIIQQVVQRTEVEAGDFVGLGMYFQLKKT